MTAGPRLRAVVAAVVASGLAGAACRTPPPEATPPARPDVVLVVLDTVRADALSCYGNPRPLTPNLDRLAAEGARFSRAFATDFWTLPSHATLLTGHYPSVAGATSESLHLPAPATTLAERLGAAGWRTAGIVRNAWLTSERGFDQGFDHYVESWRADDGRSEAEGEAAALEEGLAWLAGGASEPSFLVLNLNQAHMPYTPSAAARERWLRSRVSAERRDRLESIEGGWGHLAGALELDEEDLATMRDLYQGEVWMLDELVGRLVAGLEALDRQRPTLLVVTSDHGENIGDHGLIDHVWSMYDSTVRVPLIVRFPGRVAAGTEVDRLVSLVDLVPTVLDACGLPGGDTLPGHSLLAQAPSPERTEVFAENGRPVSGIRLLERWFPSFDTARVDHPMRMLRSSDHKLIWKVGRSAELYDLRRDPGETTDISAAEPELRARLLGELRAWAAGLDASAASELRSSDTESLERLRALGYVE